MPKKFLDIDPPTQLMYRRYTDDMGTYDKHLADLLVLREVYYRALCDTPEELFTKTFNMQDKRLSFISKFIHPGDYIQYRYNMLLKSLIQ